MFKNRLAQIALLLGILMLAIGLPIAAQSYSARGRPVAAAQISTGGEFTLSGSAGQPEVGESLSGGGFSLSGGLDFRGSTSDDSVENHAIYLPAILK